MGRQSSFGKPDCTVSNQLSGGKSLLSKANPLCLTYIPADAVAPPPYIESLLTHPGVRRAYRLVKRSEPFTAEFPALPEGTIEITGRTDVGLVREHNEDSFLFGDLSGGEKFSENNSGILRVEAVPALLMVADGVGGAASGEIASSLATEVAFKSLKEFSDRGALKGAVVIADSLQQAVLSANRAIHIHSRENRVHHGMGTTATIALVVGGMIYFAQVGDSRAYIIRANGARQTGALLGHRRLLGATIGPCSRMSNRALRRRQGRSLHFDLMFDAPHRLVHVPMLPTTCEALRRANGLATGALR